MNSPALWTTRPFYSFDIESTGANPLEAHVVTATIVKIHDGEYVDKRSWIAAPVIEIPQEAIDIHGLTNEWAQENGDDPKKVITEIVEMLEKILKAGIPLVIFNAAYDLTMVENQCEFYGVPGLRSRLNGDQWDTIIDPFVIAKSLEHFVWKEFEKGRTFKLPAVCERYGIPFTESHDAAADALGAGLLAAELVNRDHITSEKGPRELAALQKKWRKKAQYSLRIYFDKNKIAHDGVDVGWPLHTSLLESD